MNIEAFYDAAQRSGLLTAVIAAGNTVYCAFRAPDETVLDGFALSRDYQIDYPASVLTLAIGDTVEIAMADSGSPAVFRDGGPLLAIIMPMRV